MNDATCNHRFTIGSLWGINLPALLFSIQPESRPQLVSVAPQTDQLNSVLGASAICESADLCCLRVTYTCPMESPCDLGTDKWSHCGPPESHWKSLPWCSEDKALVRLHLRHTSHSDGQKLCPKPPRQHSTIALQSRFSIQKVIEALTRQTMQFTLVAFFA